MSNFKTNLRMQKGRSSSCDRNTSERNISKKRKLLENESESDEDSDIEMSNEETHHILATDKGLVDVVNEGSRSVGQSEEMKRL